MCREDLQLGARRYAKVTSQNGGTLSIAADKNRVLLRITGDSTSLAEVTIRGRTMGLTGNFALMFTNQGRPVDEITFESHGSLVQDAWNFFSGAEMVITEIIDNDLYATLKESENPLVKFNHG